MLNLSRRSVLLSVLSLPLAHPLLAAMQPYELDARKSSVGFYFNLSGTNQKGTMPVRSAQIRIDPADLTRSTVDVSVDVTRAKTNFVFARNAMLGAEVLDAKQFPTIRFVSTRVQLGKSGRISDGARIAGDLTVRGVTLPITLDAELYRRRGSASADLSTLDIRLRGQISRNSFGASGYKELVKDTITLDIRAKIQQGK
ncbi:YceI family protein [Phaeobacter gallaeciensis]|uniref:YceI family protein n=1 Tax=Phaeobacter gallaeciensis TaxID=60890 RepID=A0A366WUU8_9RHOB|nr:YceI family protein [Phaeobacter gallaeciensis]RBW52907.1 YceI family protein [Phaeobacter gallaeciensis]